MKILRVSIQNLNSLRLKKTIDFAQRPLSDTGLFAIIGDTGAGKTTILDAITLALYGKVHRNKDVKEVISYGTTACLSEAEFETREGLFRARWRLRRARNKIDGNLIGPEREFSKWHPDKKEFEILAEKNRETEALVEKITGLDYDRFCRSVLLSQGDFAAFLKANEKERSDLLERITGTEIYSNLSIGAYKRYKQEEKTLETLQHEMTLLQILDATSLKEIKATLKIKQKEGKETNAILKGLRDHLQNLKQREQLEGRLLQINQQLDEHEQKKEAFKPEAERLSLSRKAAIYKSDLSLYDAAKESSTSLALEVEQLGKELLEARAEHQKMEKQWTDSKQVHQNQKKNLQKLLPTFDEIIQMDITIVEKELPLHRSEQELSRLEGELSALIEEIQVSTKRREEWSQEISTIEQWLNDNQHYEALKSEFSLIEKQRDDLRQLFLKIQSLEKLQISTQKDLSLKESDLKQHQTIWEKANTQRDQLLNEFKQSIPENYATDRHDLINLLGNEIEELAEQQKNLQELMLLNDAYQQLLTELSTFEEALENVKGEELDINKQLMNSIEVVDNLSKRLEFKQQVFEQQQLISNYEKDRNELQEGEPCPLCFSTDHPYRNKSFTPFINEAKLELDAVKGQYEQVYQKHRQLLHRQNTLNLQIEQLEGNELKELNGQLQKQFAKILGYEEKIAKVNPSIGIDGNRLSPDESIAKRLRVSEESLLRKKQTRQKLTQISQSLEQMEKRVQAAEKNRNTSETAFQVLREKYSLTQEQLREEKKAFDTSIKELNRVIEKYGLTFDLASAAKMFNELNEKKRVFEEKVQKKEEKTRQSEHLAVEIKEKTAIKQGLKVKVSAQEKLCQKAKKTIEKIKEKRKQLFGEKDPKLERQALEVKLEKLEQESENLRNLVQNLHTIKNSKQKLIESKQKEITKLEAGIESLDKKLQKGSQHQGFASIDGLRNALLSVEEADSIESAKQHLDAQDVKIKQSLKETQDNLELLKARKFPLISIENLKEQIKLKEEANQLIQQTVGALTEKITQNDQRKKEAKQLLTEIEKQQREYARWGKLNDIIGMADGKKFRVFAQGLTLKKLAFLANQHLKQLNGRYIIEKRAQQDLTLEIVDTFQADNRRSMQTLSGGESFIVSLALALGLSDLAGRNAQIQSLFIDEGFGTLDENSLDLALTTLENLQATGKTIGIISHVGALKERISTQIQVSKKGNGFSEISIVG